MQFVMMNKKSYIKKWLRAALCLMVASLLVMPFEADAARQRQKKKTTTSVSSKSKKKTSSTSSSKKKRSSSSSSRRSRSTSVTQATSQTAINASGSSSSSSSASSSSARNRKPQSPSPLAKISVAKPDLEEIRTSTLDPSHKYYFPKLMDKYQAKDTTMTQEEYRYLYLGYMFQEDYDPYRSSPYSAVTDELRQKDDYTRDEIDTIKKYAEKVLLDNPFDLRQMSFLVHVLKEKKKNMQAKIWEYRLENLLGAIKSTGTGEDMDNAWFVIYPMHEYDMVQLLGYEAVDVEYYEPGFDYLMVQPDGSRSIRNPAKGFYFNIQVPQQQYELKHPEDESQEETVEEVSADQ